jgi:hypothetical protein
MPLDAQTDSPPPARAAPADPVPGDTRRPRLAIAGVVAAIAITLGLMGMIAFRWYRVKFPNAAVLAWGDETAVGTRITVRSLNDGRLVAEGRLLPKDGYSFVVLVEEGDYVLRAAMDEETFVETRIFVPANRGVPIQIRVPPHLRPQTQPTTAPATQQAGT